MKNINLNNEELKRKILVSTATVFNISKKTITISKVLSYNWSYIVWVSIDLGHELNNYVIKIPKNISSQSLLSATSNNNSKISIDEYLCLDKVYKNINHKNNIQVVQPLYYLSELNGIVLKEIQGKKLFELIKTRKISEDKIYDILFRLGYFLSTCHNMYGVVEESVLLDKLQIYKNYGSSFEGKIVARIKFDDNFQKINYSTMLLGFELRNIFYCIDRDTITIHDLQEVNNKPVYEDLSQFIVSLDLINWGRIFPSRAPIICYQGFINGYFCNKEPNYKLLSYFITKEYLRFHKNAQTVFASKYSNKLFRKIIMKLYYEKWISKWLSKKYWERVRG
jgi:hypothetical protein